MTEVDYWNQKVVVPAIFKFNQEFITDPSYGALNFIINKTKIPTPFDYSLTGFVEYMYNFMGQDLGIKIGDNKTIAGEDTTFLRIKFEDLSDFWQHILEPWFKYVVRDTLDCFEGSGDIIYTDACPGGRSIYELTELYPQHEYWFSIPEFVKYPCSIQIHDHALILKVYDCCEPVLLYYVQII